MGGRAGVRAGGRGGGCSCVYTSASVCPRTFTLNCSAWYGCLRVPAGVHLQEPSSAGAAEAGRISVMADGPREGGGGPQPAAFRSERSGFYDSLMEQQQLDRCSLQTESKSRPDRLNFSSLTGQNPPPPSPPATPPKQDQQYFSPRSTGSDAFLAPCK